MKDDICAHVNWLSSIEYQKCLIEELKSEQDRERYRKILEMSKTIQQKIEYLQKRPWDMTWSNASRQIHQNAYPTYHTFHPSMMQSRPSIETILFTDSCDPNDSPPLALSPHTPMDQLEGALLDEESESEEEYCSTSMIHIAVRRNASLFKIQHLKESYQKSSLLSQTGYLTPPHSPPLQEPRLPPMTHVHKRSRQSLKGLFRRTYQLNQYPISKTNSIPFTTDGLVFRSVNLETRQPKLLLKLVIGSLKEDTPESQRRYGFTFCWQKQDQDHPKLVFAPDSLVQEALCNWVNLQNRASLIQMPALKEADEIMREGRKLYIVYDIDLLSTFKA